MYTENVCVFVLYSVILPHYALTQRLELQVAPGVWEQFTSCWCLNVRCIHTLTHTHTHIHTFIPYAHNCILAHSIPCICAHVYICPCIDICSSSSCMVCEAWIHISLLTSAMKDDMHCFEKLTAVPSGTRWTWMHTVTGCSEMCLIHFKVFFNFLQKFRGGLPVALFLVWCSDFLLSLLVAWSPTTRLQEHFSFCTD